MVALAVVASALALRTSGLLRVPFLPGRPAAYGALLLAVVAAFLLIVGPARRGRWRAPLLLLGAVPFLVFTWLEAGGAAVPGLGWIAVAVLAVALAFSEQRALVAGALVLLLGAGAVLAEAGLPLMPAGWNAVSAPSREALPPREPRAEAHARDLPEGMRKGAPVRVTGGTPPALGMGRGPWWRRAARATIPGPRPVVLVLDGAAQPGVLPSGGELTAVHGSRVRFDHAFDLQAFDAVLVREGAWREDDPAGRSKARAVAGFVRKGGLVIGPAPERDWPPHLARALRHAARSRRAGPEGARDLGGGRVVRAATEAGTREVLSSGLWVPEVGTALLGGAASPPWPDTFERWRDRPSERRTQGLLLLVYVLVLAAFTRLLRGGGVQILGVFLAAAAVSAGLAWTSPTDPGFRAHGLVIDLGGTGGRRLEAVALHAGRAGYVGQVRFEGGGVVSVRGGILDADGALHVPPEATAWIVRETDALGPAGGGPEDVRALVLRPLLRGDVDPKRLRLGRLERLPVRVRGAGPIPALTATYRPAQE